MTRENNVLFANKECFWPVILQAELLEPFGPVFGVFYRYELVVRHRLD